MCKESWIRSANSLFLLPLGGTSGDFLFTGGGEPLTLDFLVAKFQPFERIRLNFDKESKGTLIAKLSRKAVGGRRWGDGQILFSIAIYAPTCKTAMFTNPQSRRSKGE